MIQRKNPLGLYKSAHRRAESPYREDMHRGMRTEWASFCTAHCPHPGRLCDRGVVPGVSGCVWEEAGRMTHPCKGCVDSSRIPGTRQYVCDYMLHNGRPRSLICPPGAACTVKSTRPRQKEEIKPEPRGRRVCWDTQMGLWLYRQGLSDAEIARRVGTTRQCVRAWRVRRGLTANNT